MQNFKNSPGVTSRDPRQLGTGRLGKRKESGEGEGRSREEWQCPILAPNTYGTLNQHVNSIFCLLLSAKVKFSRLMKVKCSSCKFGLYWVPETSNYLQSHKLCLRLWLSPDPV
jgi:hypothetical protein